MSERIEVYLAAQDAQVIGQHGNIFQFDLTKWCLPGTGCIKDFSLGLVNVVFTNTHYSINDFNNIFEFSYNGGATSVAAVEPGNYSISELLAELTATVNLLIGVPGAVSFNEAPFTQKIIITVAAGTLAYSNGQYSICPALGLFAPGVTASTHSGTAPYDISGASSMMIQSNVSQYSLHSSGRSVFCEIPVTHGFGYQVMYQPNNINFFPLDNNIGYLQFVLLDSKTGMPFTLSRATDLRFQFVLRRKHSF